MKTTVIGVIVAGLLLTGCSSQSPDDAVKSSSSNNPSPSGSFSEFPTEPSSTALAVAPDDAVTSSKNPSPTSSKNPSPSASFSEFPTESSSTALAVATEVIGMTEEDAIQTIEGIRSEQLTARVVRRDDESYAVTEDYSLSRINLEIDNGIVTKTSIG
jgi:hypothetical protein